MDFTGLKLTCSFLAGLDELAIHPPRSFEYAINRIGAQRHDVIIEHHEFQRSIAIQRESLGQVEHGLILPFFQPPVAWDLAVGLVDFAVTLFPVVEFARFQASPI